MLLYCSYTFYACLVKRHWIASLILSCHSYFLQGTGLEYDRYLRQVVEILESDDSFRKKLEQANISDIKVCFDVASKMSQIIISVSVVLFRDDYIILKLHLLYQIKIDEKGFHTYRWIGVCHFLLIFLNGVYACFCNISSYPWNSLALKTSRPKSFHDIM